MRLAVLALLGFSVACSEGEGGPASPADPPDSSPVASVSVSPGTHTFVARTGTITLSATATRADGTSASNLPVTWSSSDPGVATINSAGSVGAEAAGTATMTATVEGVSGSATVNVGQRVGPSGRTILNADGSVQLVVPAGALAAEAYVTLGVPTSTPGDPNEIPDAAVEVGPTALEFEESVDLVQTWPPGALPPGESPFSLRAFRLEQGVWVSVTPSLTEPDGASVRSTVARVGVYGLLVDELSTDATSMIAAFATDRAAAGGLLPSSSHRPRNMALDDPALTDALEQELGPDRVAVASVDPSAYDQNPPVIDADDLEVRIFGSTDLPPGGDGASMGPGTEAASGAPDQVGVADAKIRGGVKQVLELIRTLDGFNLPDGQLSDLEFAFEDAEFHEEGDQAGGIMVPDDAHAVSFPLGFDQFEMFGLDGGIVVIYDGRSHVVFTEEDSKSLRDGKVQDEDGSLSTAAATALHELIHLMLEIRGKGDKDDDADLVVSSLETAIVAKINLELDRKANGTPDPGKVRTYNSALARAIENGAGDCLHLIGLPPPAGTLTVDIPDQVEPGGTFTVKVTVLGPDGVPLADEDVYVNQSHFDEDGNPVFDIEDPDRPKPEVVQTDLGGDASTDVTATDTKGHININVQVGGKTFNGRIEVKPKVGPPQEFPLGLRLDGTLQSGQGECAWAPTISNPGPISLVTEVVDGKTFLTIQSDADVRGEYNPETGEWTGSGETQVDSSYRLRETIEGVWETEEDGSVVLRGTMTFELIMASSGQVMCTGVYQVEFRPHS
jgi:hypothetical protein